MAAVIVLGMHFSGTSSLAEALIRAGVDFGAHLRKGNLYPTYEDNRIALLHNRLMTWDDPRVFVPTAVACGERDRIVASYEGRSFGFKEPSTLFFASLWAPVASQYVGTFRHPSLVTAHIKKHWGRTSVPANELWMRYASRLLVLHREHRFPLVCFDDDAAEYGAALTRAVEYVCGPGACVRFDLANRSSHAPEPASDAALAIYDELKEAAAQSTEAA